MLLAKIKKELDSLYDDIREAAAAVEAAAEPAEPEAVQEAAPQEEEPQAAADSGEAPGEAQESAEQEAPAEEPPPIGPQETDYQAKGYHLDAALPPEKVVAAAEILSRYGFFIEAVTGVDWIDDGQMEVVYDFNHFDEL